MYWSDFTEVPDVRPRTAAEKKAHVMQITKEWHEGLKTLYEAADHDTASVRVLSSKPDGGLWPDARSLVITIGDAAHPASPMGGSVGDTAVVNVASLAHTILIEGVTQSSIAAFEDRMRARAKATIDWSFTAGAQMWQGRPGDHCREVSV